MTFNLKSFLTKKIIYFLLFTRPLEFIDCEEPIDHKGNKTAKEEAGKGCIKFGGSRYEDVERAAVTCEVLPDIECFGPRVFKKEGVPCIKYIIFFIYVHHFTNNHLNLKIFFSKVQGSLLCHHINIQHFIRISRYGSIQFRTNWYGCW